MTRAFLQKRASLAEGILFNMCQGLVPSEKDIESIVDMSIKMADHMLEKLYGAKKEE